MLNPEQLAEKIVHAIQHRQQELNMPQSVHFLLKLYQLAPRFLRK